MLEEKNQGGVRIAEDHKNQGVIDFSGLAKFYKDSSLDNLEPALKEHEETEKLIVEALSQGFSIPNLWLKLIRRGGISESLIRNRWIP